MNLWENVGSEIAKETWNLKVVQRKKTANNPWVIKYFLIGSELNQIGLNLREMEQD